MQKFNKHNTFILRKLSISVSSIMIASGVFIIAGQDGKEAKKGKSNEAQIEVKQQYITQPEPQETNKASSSSDSISLNSKPETSEAPLVKQPAPSEKSATAPIEEVSEILLQTSLAYENVDFNAPAVKGIWQVTPTLDGWDHTDFTGQYALD